MHTAALVTMLARVCVSEAGFFAHDECAVIVSALTQQAADRGAPLPRQVCAYAPNSCNRRRQDARRWIAHLSHTRTTAPPGWFGNRASWQRYREHFADMRDVVQQTLDGDRAPVCAGYHWAARWCESCARRMRASGFRRLRCPTMRNAWYARGGR